MYSHSHIHYYTGISDAYIRASLRELARIEPKRDLNYKGLFIYRIIAFVLLLVHFIIYLIESQSRAGKNVSIYLSQWSHILTLLSFFCLIVGRPDKKVTFLLNNLLGVTVGISGVILVLYWSWISRMLLYKSTLQHYADGFLHTAGFIFLCIDFAYHRVYLKWPANMLLIIFIYTLYFIVATVMYTRFKLVIYRNITYNNWQSLVFALGSTISSILVFTVFWWLQRKYKFNIRDKEEGGHPYVELGD